MKQFPIVSVICILILASCANKGVNLVKGSSGITIAQDSIQLNPTGCAPLCAVVTFTTPVRGSTKIIVHGKTGGIFDISHQFSDTGLHHSVMVAGLYADYANSVDIKCIDSNGSVAAETTITIITPALSGTWPTKYVSTTLQNNAAEPGVNLVSSLCSSTMNIPYMVDDNGDIRWLLNFFKQ